MKLKNLSIFLLLFNIVSIQAQVKGEATYLIKHEVDFVLDSTNRKGVNHEVHRLYTGATASNYISEGRFYRDSLSKAMRNQPRGAMRNIGRIMRKMPTSEFDPVVFINFNNSEVWIKNSISSDQFLYQEPNVPIVWDFTGETKQIE